MISIPHDPNPSVFSEDAPKPAWWRMGEDDPEHFRPALVILRCGECGKTSTLRHSIADDGTVSPSLVCPHGCGWHVWGCLEGWR